MGGTNEKQITNPASLSSKRLKKSPQGVHITSNVRIHGSKGMVHIHDDANSRKTEIPESDFKSKYQVFRSNPLGSPIKFIDTNNKTVATISGQVDDPKGHIEAIIDVEPMDVASLPIGPGLQALSDFADGN